MELHRINTLGTQEKHCIKVFRKIINKNYLFEIFFCSCCTLTHESFGQCNFVAPPDYSTETLEFEPPNFSARFARLAPARKLATARPNTVSITTNQAYHPTYFTLIHRPEQLPATPTTYFYLSFLILTPFPYLNTLSTMYPNLINIFVHATDTRTLTIARMTYPELPRTSCCCVLREPRSNLHRSVEIR